MKDRVQKLKSTWRCHWKRHFKKSSEALTEQGQEIIKTYAEEYERDILADLLIMNCTGKDFVEQGKIIIRNTPNGKNCWYKVLAGSVDLCAVLYISEAISPQVPHNTSNEQSFCATYLALL
jgi:hypothetical protein